jgi:hypothetical protein
LVDRRLRVAEAGADLGGQRLAVTEMGAPFRQRGAGAPAFDERFDRIDVQRVVENENEVAGSR